MLIERVAEGSPAQKAGIRGGTVDAVIGGVPVLLGGDLILKVNDVPAGETEQIGVLLAKAKAGDKVHYTLLRAGKPVEVDVEVPVRVLVPKLPLAPAPKR